MQNRNFFMIGVWMTASSTTLTFCFPLAGKWFTAEIAQRKLWFVPHKHILMKMFLIEPEPLKSGSDEIDWRRIPAYNLVLRLCSRLDLYFGHLSISTIKEEELASNTVSDLS